MKKNYIVPNTEKVRVCGKANILDSKFGNSGYVPDRGQSGDDDDDYDFQGSKPKWGDWDEESTGKESLWKN